MKCGVYRILNKIAGKFYIGSSVDIIKRCKQHVWFLENNRHLNQYLQNAWNKYGPSSFDFEIIEICTSDIILEREQYYLNELKPTYNILLIAGSTLGSTRSSETKAKMAAWQVGRKMSESARENMRLAKKKTSQWPCEAGILCKCENCLFKIREYKKLKAREYRAIK